MSRTIWVNLLTHKHADKLNQSNKLPGRDDAADTIYQHAGDNAVTISKQKYPETTTTLTSQ